MKSSTPHQVTWQAKTPCQQLSTLVARCKRFCDPSPSTGHASNLQNIAAWKALLGCQLRPQGPLLAVHLPPDPWIRRCVGCVHSTVVSPSLAKLLRSSIRSGWLGRQPHDSRWVESLMLLPPQLCSGKLHHDRHPAPKARKKGKGASFILLPRSAFASLL